jgi:sigma-B regulation protein RsbU (phosphoserine phosphatase)
MQIAAFSRPADIVGGDYFGFFEFAGGAQGLAIADVAGHGVSSSLHMASVHALLQALIATTNSPAEVLEHVQRLFIHNASFTTFVTIFLGAYAAETRRLSYTNAGHNPPIVISRRQSRELAPTGPAVGLIERAVFRVESVELSPGDVLLLYTDGVTEAKNGDHLEYGAVRLADTVCEAAHLAVGDILQAIRQDLERFVGTQPLDDDTTLVVCKISG